MHLPGYLASSVTVVTSLLMHSRLLCGEGLLREGCSAAEWKEEDDYCHNGHTETY